MKFAVLDVETTGFSPNYGDRIVEIGIITIDHLGNELDSFETLINPKRAVTASHIHHITDEMVIHAPSFDDIIGDVSYHLQGKTIVGHNLGFDLRFVNYQMNKSLEAYRPLNGLCTLELSRLVAPGLPKRSLDFLCNYFDIKNDYSHTAISDCRATSQLFNIFKELIIKHEGIETFSNQFCNPSELFCELPPKGICLKRADAKDKIEEEINRLQALLMRLPADSKYPVSFEQYLDVLENAISDRVLTENESKQLYNVAKEFGMTYGQVADVHKDYLKSLTRIYLYDNIITPTELADLKYVGKILGFNESAVISIIENEKQSLLANQFNAIENSHEDIIGKSICFTGELTSKINGQYIERSYAQKISMERGLIIKSGVNKNLDYLVTANPSTMSGKAQKARKYGVQIIPEPVFWNMIGITVE